MKGYIEERAIELANYIVERKTTVRAAAKKFGISKSTVHKDGVKWNGILISSSGLAKRLSIAQFNDVLGIGPFSIGGGLL